MKKLSLIFSALLLILTPYLNTQWQTIQTPYNANYADVSVVNQDVIWVCGNPGAVVKTTNGGQSWNMVNNGLPNIGFGHVTAIDENFAWITGGTNGDKIFRTTDGGNNWTEQFYNEPKWIDKIHFFNINTGIFVRDPLNAQSNDTVGFFITRNGGANWYRSANTPRSAYLCDCSVGIMDSNLVWFVSSDKVYKLTGGLDNQWQIFNTGLNPIYTARFIDQITAYATDGPSLIKTTNGGANWTQTLSNFNTGSLSFITVPNSNMIVANNSGSIRISYDLGNNWQERVLSGSVHYSDAYDTNSIWIAGPDGKLLKYNFGYIGINLISTEVPTGFKVYQNYPNPFNPTTKIKFDLPKSGNISFKVYNVTGKSVYEINEFKTAGTYDIQFDGSKLASGIYYYRIESNDFAETKKMVLIK